MNLAKVMAMVTMAIAMIVMIVDDHNHGSGVVDGGDGGDHEDNKYDEYDY